MSRSIMIQTWLIFERSGQSQIIECDRNAIIRRTSVSTRDLRILHPLYSHSCNIIARDNAMVINLEFVKALVTAEEVLILDPFGREVISFVDELRQQLPKISARTRDEQVNETRNLSDDFDEFPFEFQVLEIALKVVYAKLNSEVSQVESEIYPLLDELTTNVNSKNLQVLRTLKSAISPSVTRIQELREEIESLLDDDHRLAKLYLTRKLVGVDQNENIRESSETKTTRPRLRRAGTTIRRRDLATKSKHSNDIEDLEILLEGYFLQLARTRSKILTLKSFISDTEEYVNLQLDSQRNRLIHLQMILMIASVAIAIEGLVVGIFGMNIPTSLYKKDGIFEQFVGSLTACSIFLFLLILCYARSKNLIVF